MKTVQEVKDAFTPVVKLEPGQVARLGKLNMAFIDLATDILDLVPSCEDREHSLIVLREAKHLCADAVTHAWPKTEDKENKSKLK